jgi:hypothetical protein
MAVLMVLFNPTGATRLVANWLYTWNKLRAAGIPVFGAELLFPYQSAASLAPEFKTITVRSDSLMFHKEKLLERLEREVPATYTKICAIDCDVIFRKPTWYDLTSEALDTATVAQPYSRCNWMGADLRTTVMSNPSAAACLSEIRADHATGSDRLTGHPGFAMAWRRGAVRPFPHAVVGGGDAVFFRATCGLVGEFVYPPMERLMTAAWTSYKQSVGGVGDIVAVDGDIYHMWHGPIKGRQYYDRYVKFFDVVPSRVRDIRELLVENEDGVWSWRPDVRKEANAMMLRYFAGRDDDAVG